MKPESTNDPALAPRVVLDRVVSHRRAWKTYPMGAAAAERMEMRKMKAYLDHAVYEPCREQRTTVCGVLTHSLCMDDSLATTELPDCPRCRAKLANDGGQR